MLRAYFFLRTARNVMLAGLVSIDCRERHTMSEVDRLRELAAYYSRLADLTSRDDVRKRLIAFAAETLEKAYAFERQMTLPVINSTVPQPAQQQQQQQQQQQIQPKHDDSEKQ
jgi:hypothetical protein